MINKKSQCSIICVLLITALFATVCCLSACSNDCICEKTQIKNGKFNVDGELVLPQSGSNFPAVVIVGDSGNIDMDGSVGVQKPYKHLAYALAKKGIASLRFNKVTYQYPDEVATDTKFTVDDEYFDALNSCIELLNDDSRIDSKKIFLLGHSLGAQIISVTLQQNATLAGGIIMAGTTAHISDLLMEQIGRQNTAQYNEYLPYSEYAKSLTSVPVGEENRYYFGAYSAYWVSYNALDRLAVQNVKCPLLVLQGALDLQVTVDHFETYKELLKNKNNVTFKLYEDLNHIFSNGKGETIKTAYTRPATIPQYVIDDIASFIL